jgi:hypothetical protein
MVGGDSCNPWAPGPEPVLPIADPGAIDVQAMIAELATMNKKPRKYRPKSAIRVAYPKTKK